jgi:hypothetical protein
LIVPVRAGQNWVPLVLVDAYVPVRLEAPNVPVKEKVQAETQDSVAPVSMHPFSVAVYCVPFTVPETVYCGSAFCSNDMFHVPDVRPAALASDIVTTPLPLFESTILPEKTVGDGPGTNGNSGLTGEALLQAITVKLADAAKHTATRRRIRWRPSNDDNVAESTGARGIDRTLRQIDHCPQQVRRTAGTC